MHPGESNAPFKASQVGILPVPTNLRDMTRLRYKRKRPGVFLVKFCYDHTASKDLARIASGDGNQVEGELRVAHTHGTCHKVRLQSL